MGVLVKNWFPVVTIPTASFLATFNLRTWMLCRGFVFLGCDITRPAPALGWNQKREVFCKIAVNRESRSPRKPSTGGLQYTTLAVLFRPSGIKRLSVHYKALFDRRF